MLATIKKNKKDVLNWKKINWKVCEKYVSRLQKMIFKKSKAGNVFRVRKLQKTLTNSLNAKLLAVSRVTQENREKRTAGSDDILVTKNTEQIELALKLKLTGRADRIRRITIPKLGGKKRILGIPTINDRCTQALMKFAIEPEHEAKFESNSYGFRPGRGGIDAIKHVFSAIRTKGKYVIDADIEKCFDRIEHKKLLDLCEYTCIFKEQINAWLKAGILKDYGFEIDKKGTPQGSVISPLLANIALNGLQEIIENWCLKNPLYRNGKKIQNRDLITVMHYNRYADDIKIFCHELEPLKKILIVMEEFLAERGLNLNKEKTKICHTLNDINGVGSAGVNYLGFIIKHFRSTHRSARIGGSKAKSPEKQNKKNPGIKLRIYPDPKKINSHYKHLKKLTKIHSKKKPEILIKILAPVIRGWTNYFKYSHLSSMSMETKSIGPNGLHTPQKIP